MFGINYRYELNQEKGTIKLAPTRRMYVFGIAPYVIIPVALWLASLFDRKQPVPEENLDQNLTND